MSLQRWNPFEELSRLEDEISKIFSTSRGEEDLVPANRTYSPLTDVHETADEFVVRSNIPGVKKEELEIEATPEYLEIRVESKREKEEKDDKKAKVLYKERYARKYLRKIGFSSPVDPNKAKTSLKDGVLTIRLPKAEQAKAVKLLPE
ncbi:MAG: Hsp20/alpha crystallin family protein [Candidatus Odinarchaeota archaeon]